MRYVVSRFVRRRWSTALIASLTVPMAVGVRIPSDSSSAEDDGWRAPGTRIGIAGGTGTYARYYTYSDCNGEHKIPESVVKKDFVDVSASVEHQFAGGPSVGIAGGYVRDGREVGSGSELNVYYVTPKVGVEKRSFGLGVGVLITSASVRGYERQEPYPYDDHLVLVDESSRFYPSGHLRIGGDNYFMIRRYEGMPIHSGGGAVDACLGARRRRMHVLTGFTVEGVYEGWGMLTNIHVDVGSNTGLRLNLRAGTAEGEYEWGGGLGLEYRLRDDR